MSSWWQTKRSIEKLIPKPPPTFERTQQMFEEGTQMIRSANQSRRERIDKSKGMRGSFVQNEFIPSPTRYWIDKLPEQAGRQKLNTSVSRTLRNMTLISKDDAQKVGPGQYNIEEKKENHAMLLYRQSRFVVRSEFSKINDRRTVDNELYGDINYNQVDKRPASVTIPKVGRDDKKFHHQEFGDKFLGPGAYNVSTKAFNRLSKSVIK